jgi:polar amino acid transport system ATP-binding protein/glutamine transport system ATP-binding protein
MIEVDHIAKAFGGVTVLDDVSATFADGEVVAIVGPSGAGKSTLIRCINGLERLDRGDIRVDGQSVRHGAALKAIRRSCAMVFQQFNLYPHMTVLANITLAPIVVLKTPRAAAKARARALLDMVGLGDRAGAYPAQLSGGQQQRVGICRALAMEPRHLLLDEVTSALDPEMTAEVLTVIERLAKGGTTMILVTHEMEFARRVAHRAIFMEAGKLVADQPIGAFFGNAQDPRIQRFLTKMAREGSEEDRP